MALKVNVEHWDLGWFQSALREQLNAGCNMLSIAALCLLEFNRLFVTVTDISRPSQPKKLIPLLPGPGFDPSFSGHNDRRAITASGHDYALDRSAIGAGIL